MKPPSPDLFYFSFMTARPEIEDRRLASFFQVFFVFLFFLTEIPRIFLYCWNRYFFFLSPFRLPSLPFSRPFPRQSCSSLKFFFVFLLWTSALCPIGFLSLWSLFLQNAVAFVLVLAFYPHPAPFSWQHLELFRSLAFFDACSPLLFPSFLIVWYETYPQQRWFWHPKTSAPFFFTFFCLSPSFS